MNYFFFLSLIINIAGLIVLLSIILKIFKKNNEENTYISIVKKASSICIKIGSFSAIIYTMYSYFLMSGGILSLFGVGFYVICGSIMYDLFKYYKIDLKLLEDVGKFVPHKVEKIQRSSAEKSETDTKFKS